MSAKLEEWADRRKETRGKEIDETRERREKLKYKNKVKKNKDKGKTKKSK